MSYQTIIKLSEISIQKVLKYYTESASESIIPKNLLKTVVRKLNGRLTIILSFHKMIYTQLHGKRNLVDTYLTFLSYILTLMQLILMKATHRDQILLLSHVRIFMIQAMVKIGKLSPLLTHLYCVLQIFNRKVKVKTLRPLETHIAMIVTNNHPSHAQTLKLYVTLCHNHQDIEVCKILFKPFLCSILILYFFFFRTHII